MEQKYLVALSFAGADRDFAEKVALTLRSYGVTVFYDKYEQHELWGKDLFVTLRQIYTHDCRHVVMILSSAYLERMWTRFERQQIIEKMALNYGQDAVLPVRLDGFNEEVPGLAKGIGYLPVTSGQPDIVAENLLRKLGRVGCEIGCNEAYERALRMLSDRDRMVLRYDRMFTSVESMQSEFSAVVRGDILNWVGNEFTWKREAGQPLSLYARNQSDENTKNKGFVELSRFDAPDAWVGCGRWMIYWLQEGARQKVPEDTDENPALFVALYLYSPSTNDMDSIVEHVEEEATFLAALFLKGENAERFYAFAERRFRSLS